jgi:hypothetical protein
MVSSIEKKYMRFCEIDTLINRRDEKKKFIMKFIDEIPELSYYEAKQLEKKLGNIYLEWNDEIYDKDIYLKLIIERQKLRNTYKF